MDLKKIKSDLNKLKNKKDAIHLQRFFKTGKGEYGEGDVFLGIRVPVLRKLSKKYNSATLKDASTLLKSIYHEERLLALFFLINIFKSSNEQTRKKVYNIYIKNTRFINSWDLIDLSAHHIVGPFLWEKDKAILHKLAKSKVLWERRISIIATFDYIRQNEFKDALKISKTLLYDNHDLIHKAVGWMLREIGKRDLKTEENFLKKHYKTMPRVMLRYAIEKFDEPKRKRYLLSKI